MAVVMAIAINQPFPCINWVFLPGIINLSLIFAPAVSLIPNPPIPVFAAFVVQWLV